MSEEPAITNVAGPDLAAGRWDVVVIGAGPAGLSTAIPLARSGLRVLLVERKRFPRDKVCGGCLNVGAVEQLRALGLGDELVAAGAVPLERFAWGAAGRHAEIEIPGGLVLTRATLDQLLLTRAVRDGAHVVTGTRASLGELRGADREVVVETASGAITIVARVVVVAAGLAGQTLLGGTGNVVVSNRSRVGVGCVLDVEAGSRADSRFVPGTVCMAVGWEGYVGVARAEAGRLLVAAALDPRAVRADGAAAVCRVLLARNGWALPDRTGAEDWRGTIQLSRRRTRPAAERLFFVGDAAGYVEPFTGEGIGWALDGGRRLAPLVEQACHEWNDGVAAEWARVYHRCVGRRQWTCRAVTTMLRSPHLVHFGVFVARRFPRIVRPVVRHLRGGDLRP